MANPRELPTVTTKLKSHQDILDVVAKLAADPVFMSGLSLINDNQPGSKRFNELLTALEAKNSNMSISDVITSKKLLEKVPSPTELKQLQNWAATYKNDIQHLRDGIKTAYNEVNTVREQFKAIGDKINLLKSDSAKDKARADLYKKHGTKAAELNNLNELLTSPVNLNVDITTQSTNIDAVAGIMRTLLYPSAGLNDNILKAAKTIAPPSMRSEIEDNPTLFDRRTKNAILDQVTKSGNKNDANTLASSLDTAIGSYKKDKATSTYLKQTEKILAELDNVIDTFSKEKVTRERAENLTIFHPEHSLTSALENAALRDTFGTVDKLTALKSTFITDKIAALEKAHPDSKVVVQLQMLAHANYKNPQQRITEITKFTNNHFTELTDLGFPAKAVAMETTFSQAQAAYDTFKNQASPRHAQSSPNIEIPREVTPPRGQSEGAILSAAAAAAAPTTTPPRASTRRQNMQVIGMSPHENFEHVQKNLDSFATRATHFATLVERPVTSSEDKINFDKAHDTALEMHMKISQFKSILESKPDSADKSAQLSTISKIENDLQKVFNKPEPTVGIAAKRGIEIGMRRGPG